MNTSGCRTQKRRDKINFLLNFIYFNMNKTILTSLILFCGVTGHGQLNPVQQKAIILKRMVEQKHVSPRPVDDSFSVAVFRSLIQDADPRRLLFTASEFQQLLSYSTSLDDEINGRGWVFFDKFSEIYKKILIRADSLVNKLLQKPFDYNATETIIQSRKTNEFNFSNDVAALFSRWTRYLKYVILDNVFDAVNIDSLKKTNFRASLVSLEPGIREKIKKAESKAIRRVLDYPTGFPALVTEMYLNSIASSFDPHSNYFSPQGKESFQAELSTEAYFFGIVFDEDENGKVVVGKLTPGGPAWKSGEINKGDELVSLQWEGKEVQDMEGASLQDVYEVIDQSVHDKLLFRFKKTDGTVSMVFLRKEKSENEENIVKSFVLKGDKTIGYILLPGFYTEWENESGSSCANDVAKEILKLKKENIEGLILDVRYNGGGSVGEALEMIGIFIDEGPLAAEKDRMGKLITLKDPNRGTIYDGPLALMINGQSASASEMLAAALQDYNRAVLAGSSTYGKATGQTMFPMDTITSKRITGNENGDMIKITVGKLYRVSGQTAQLNGVKPDVLLPDAFDGLEIGERFEKFALSADSVKKNNYYKPLAYLPLAELAHRSAARVLANPDFQLITKIVNERQNTASTRTVPLKSELFEKWMQQQQTDVRLMKGDGKTAAGYKVENHNQGKQLLNNDPYAKEINLEWLQNLGSDIYIQEVYSVLTDLINLQKTSTKN